MNHKGHFGLTLLIFSIFMLPFGFSENAVAVMFLAAGFSSLPDIDLRLGIKHRKYTHNILAALVFGIIFGFLFSYSTSDIFWGIMGFISGFGGVVCHLLGDAFTYMKFKPLWPFSDREVGLGWFEAGNKRLNDGMMTAGLLVFILYLLITTGALEDIISSSLTIQPLFFSLVFFSL